MTSTKLGSLRGPSPDELQRILVGSWPLGHPPSRRKIRAVAYRLWVRLGARQRKALGNQLRAVGYQGQRDWSVFLDFVLSTSDSPLKPRSTPPAVQTPIDLTPNQQQATASARSYILNRCKRDQVLASNSRSRLIELILPLWRGLHRTERTTLSTALQAEGFTDSSLFENMVGFAREVIRVDRQSPRNQHQLDYRAADQWTSGPQHPTVTQKEPSDSHAVISSVPQPPLLDPRRGITGNGRPAPSCRYCGELTELGGRYTFCVAVEKRTEYWRCTRPACPGRRNATLYQYPVREYERRG